MVVKTELLPGVTLRCYPDDRFKQGRLSLQFVRKMCREEAAMNALLPALLLQGTKNYPDARAVTIRLDELYGASVGTLTRRVGDYQTTGLSMAFWMTAFPWAVSRFWRRWWSWPGSCSLRLPQKMGYL